jgi:riboflavin kinase/FMN adenylyltransferase
MKIIRGIDMYPKTNMETAVALGSFDGVHLGHQKLIKILKDESENRGLSSLVFTFYPHPLKIIAPQSEPPMITSLDQRADLIAQYGIDYFLVANFDQEFAKISAEDFIINLLYKKLNAKTVVIGFNNTFGYKGLGTPKMLKEFGDKLGFKVVIVEPVTKNGIVVSSTEIRKTLLEGKITLANELLGRHFFLEGKVVRGDGRGKKLGFPTANLEVSPDIVIPNNGVYAVKVTYDGKAYAGALNIGTKPTFAGKIQTVEVNIIGFSKNIYGEVLKVEFLEKLRSEKTFASPAELSAQIDLDTKKAAEIFNQRTEETII